MIGGLVLAAGASRRFGGVKQVARFRGRPLLEHVLEAMAAARLDRVVVVLGAHAEEIRTAVPLHGAEAVVAPEWAEGIAASLRAGVATLADCDAIVVALGDQPLLSPEAIARVAAAGGPAARATYGGVPAHPVLIARSLFGELRALEGDHGAGALLRDAKEVACDGLGSPADVDTPEDLQ